MSCDTGRLAFGKESTRVATTALRSHMPSGTNTIGPVPDEQEPALLVEVSGFVEEPFEPVGTLREPCANPVRTLLLTTSVVDNPVVDNTPRGTQHGPRFTAPESSIHRRGAVGEGSRPPSERIRQDGPRSDPT